MRATLLICSLPLRERGRVRGGLGGPMLMRRLSFLAFILSIPFLSILACGGDKQVSGIFAEAAYSTEACVGKEKIIHIRNDNSSEPQRIMGVYFEYGTNKDNVFKITKVSVGSAEYAPTNSNLAQEIIIPAGDVMSVYTTYDPQVAGNHETYLDVFLNGPQLGIKQIRLKGATTDDKCAEVAANRGTIQNFNITSLKIIVKASSLPGGVLELPVAQADIHGSVKFASNRGRASMKQDEFPTFTLRASQLPGGQANVGLDIGTYQGTFDGSKLEFPSIIISLQGAVKVTAKMTTDTATASNTLGSLTPPLQGTPLAAGRMKLVLAGKLDNPLLQSLNGGVVGAEIELQEATGSGSASTPSSGSGSAPSGGAGSSTNP